MKFIAPILLILFLVACDNNGPLSPSEEITSIPLMKLRIEPEDLNRLQAAKLTNLEVPAYLVYGGEKFNCLVRASGAGSRYHDKWGFKIIMQNGLTPEGYSEFNLSSQIFDPSALKTLISLRLYEEMGLLTHNVKHIFLVINEKDYGLYPMIERVEKDFFDRRALPVNELFKVKFGSSFSFNATNNPEFTFDKEMPRDNNYSSLNELIYAIDTSSAVSLEESLSKFLDLDNYLRYHAVTSVLNNIDAFTNNYFLYRKTHNSPFSIIPWDFDKAFSDQPTAPLWGDNEIIRKIFLNDELKEQYKEHLVYIIDNLFTADYLFPFIDENVSKIRQAYILDPWLGLRYDFDTEIEKIKDYIATRRLYIRDNLSQLD